MTSKTISIREDVYNKLLATKGRKSFSDGIIDLLLEKRNDFSSIIGKSHTLSWNDFEKERKYDHDDKRDALLAGHKHPR